MALIIPGVQISVVQEIVPPQLSPSGVLGLIGVTEKPLSRVERISSWARFLEVCGSASAYSLPEAKHALNNGVYQLAVVSLTQPNSSDLASAQAYALRLIQISPKEQSTDSLKIGCSDRAYTFTFGTFSQSSLDANSTGNWLQQLQKGNLATTDNGLNFEAQSPAGLLGFQSVDLLSTSGQAIIQPNSCLLIYDASNPIDNSILILNSGSSLHSIMLEQSSKQQYQVSFDGSQGSGRSVLEALAQLLKELPSTSTPLSFALTPAQASTLSGNGGLKLPFSLLLIDKVLITAKAPGSWANGMVVNVEAGSPGSKSESRLTLKLYLNTADQQAEKPVEMFRDKSMNDINGASNLITLNQSTSPSNGNSDVLAGCYLLAGGRNPSAASYSTVLALLNDEPDVDLVLASMPATMDPGDMLNTLDAIKSHCEQASSASQPRIGFGQVPKGFTDDAASVWSSKLNSERFVLVAPHGAAAAVVGRVGSLDYFESPTFKTLSGLDVLNPVLPQETQESLLKANLLPVSFRRGRGYIMVRALTTSGGQISVCRIADRAVRGVRLIGELFIGTLNNEDGRNALRQKITEFLMQMKNDGALVPSTDGKSPPFSISVYSSETDFAQGIVRIELAVRPVRSIDFIYATILVQA
jgi:hypothetical protein